LTGAGLQQWVVGRDVFGASEQTSHPAVLRFGQGDHLWLRGRRLRLKRHVERIELLLEDTVWRQNMEM